MTGSRATLGADLLLDLRGREVRTALEQQLRDAVRQGRLAPGTRLPSSRALAKELGIGRNSVAEAYGQLVAEGWLVARHGAGTWVAERLDTGPTAVPDAQPEPRRVRFDLRPGVPTLGAFPRSEWLAAARRVLGVVPAGELGYGDPRGVRVLREALAGYLVRARRVAAAPERVVVTSGFADGLALVSAALRGRGATTVAVEAYGLDLHRQIIRAAGLETVALPVDAGGAVVDGLDGHSAVLLTPAHQFPTGVVLDPARRRQVVQWAADAGGVVIEDDYDGEFRYDRQAVGAMQSLAPEQVVYAGTASKSLAPGLRVGWLVLPPGLVEDVAEVKRLRGRFPAVLDELTLAELITSGGFDRQVRRARLAYRRRRDRLVAALAEHAPAVEVSGIAAGLHALVHLDGGDEGDVLQRAAARGLALEGLRTYTAPGHERPPALVVGYATPPDHAYTAALARLTAVLSP